MTKQDTKIIADEKPTGLSLMRAPFASNQISQLPKPTKSQTDDVRANFQKGIRCDVCGQWHHPKVVHLDYVGHAALTDRLLDCDPEWNWTPVKTDDSGVPIYDENGGMWIRLTVCGVTRMGYGDAQGKRGANAVKEVIGDALRNAAMRFGAALDLWHKGELHVDDDEPPAPKVDDDEPPEPKKDATSGSAATGFVPAVGRDKLKAALLNQTDPAALDKLWNQKTFAEMFAKMPDQMKAELTSIHTNQVDKLRPSPNAEFTDEIPYQGEAA